MIMLNDDMYDFMCMGKELIYDFVEAYPDDFEGHAVIQAYVALATSIAQRVLNPSTPPQRIVEEFESRYARENPSSPAISRH